MFAVNLVYGEHQVKVRCYLWTRAFANCVGLIMLGVCIRQSFTFRSLLIDSCFES